jgi:hypothetical protein
MKIWYVSLFSISLIVGLLSCASNPRVEDLSSEQRAKYAQIEILETQPSRPFKILGTVKGISCHRNAYQKHGLSSDEAINGVRLQAAEYKADAVINMVCQENKEADWGNNCWSSFVCVGDAIKYSIQQ